MRRSLIFLLAGMVLFPVLTFAGGHKGSKTVQKASNTVYKSSCGACHLAYQPGLLPARSWRKIMNEPGGHAGGELSLDTKTKAEIERYLTQNSAEQSQSKRSRKIVASIGSDAPTRISQVPYIREKHHEIKQDVFARKSIGWRGNCIACHRTAEDGDYDGDNVTIPK